MATAANQLSIGAGTLASRDTDSSVTKNTEMRRQTGETHYEESAQLVRVLESLEEKLDGKARGELARNWLLAGIAILTAISGGASYLQNVSHNAGAAAQDFEQIKKDYQRDHERLENLRTLYLIRFGEDPDKVTPETMKRGPNPAMKGNKQ